VKFGDTEVLVIEVSDQYIKIKVPRDLKKQKSKITIDNGNESVVSFKDFVLNAPALTEFSPQTGTFGNTITITGQNFNPVPEFNGVMLGLAPAVVKEATSAMLTIEVPENYNALDGKSKVTVTTSGGKVESLADFHLSLHTIASFTPINGNRNDILTLTGQNFNPVAAKNEVYIGSARAAIITASTMAISFTVPSSTARGNHLVRLRVGGREITANQTFFSDDPWSIKADISGGGRKYAVAFNVAGKGYVVGGLDNHGNYKNELLQFDPINNEWIKLNDIPVNGEGMVAFATATKGYVLFHKELWQYDPGKNQWQKKAPFPGFAGRFQSAFSIGESGYVGAGVSAELYSSMPTNEFYEYEETTDQWFARKSFPPGGMQWGIGFSAGDKGFFALGSWTHRDIWEYKPANDTWEKKLDLLNIVYNINLMRLWAVSVSGNSKAYFGTGSDNTAIWMKRFSDLYEYDPVTNTCKRVEDMPGLGRTQAFGFSIGKL
jgi:N-acetylneuraminic acid mutarotase